jgi:hypothetical protein
MEWVIRPAAEASWKHLSFLILSEWTGPKIANPRSPWTRYLEVHSDWEGRKTAATKAKKLGMEQIAELSF